MTTELAVQWAVSSRSSDPAQAARRLSAVRQFARHRAIVDPAAEIPPAGLLGRVGRRKQPHIYSADELAALLREASLLPPSGGLRPRTYVTFFSLLLSTGLRLSEACRLAPGDVDLANGVLTIRESKFRKSRLVPLHPSATEALARYVAHRDACRDASRSGGFLRTERCPVLTRAAVEKTFSRLRQRLGWTAQGRARRPRIHDLRHTFVVQRLVRWYEDGADVDRKILALATYLGHAKVSDTYWYLSAAPELMAITSQRFERFTREEQETGS
jgi:integrase